MTLREFFDKLRAIYCGKAGFEFRHIPNRKVKNWFRDRIELNRPINYDRSQLLQLHYNLLEVKALSQFVH
jgi:2-oxoglutarate dehydrogenase complex dehydrogenase (E1) component-like enzyme